MERVKRFLHWFISNRISYVAACVRETVRYALAGVFLLVCWVAGILVLRDGAIGSIVGVSFGFFCLHAIEWNPNPVRREPEPDRMQGLGEEIVEK